MNMNENYSHLFSEAFKALDVNPNEVSRKAGVASLKIYNIINGKFKPGYDTIQQILAAYPRINANWLLKGQKPILHTSSAHIVDSGLNFVSLRLVPTTANFDDNMNLMHSVLIPNGVDATVYSDSVVVSISDNSMTPKLPIHTKMLARPIPFSKWDYTGGGLYAILYGSDFVVRRIKGNDLPTKNFLTIYADNEEFGYLHIKRDDLKSIWKIVEIVGGGID